MTYRRAGEVNEKIACACGCGQELWRFDQWGKARQYISGHQVRKSDGFRQKTYVAMKEVGGPADVHTIAAAVGLDHHRISPYLARLKKDGLIRRVAVGIWEVIE